MSHEKVVEQKRLVVGVHDSLQVLIQGKYAAKHYVAGEKVERVTHKLLKCAVMGGAFWVNAENSIASQILPNRNYTLTFSLTPRWGEAGLNYRVGEVLDFKLLP